MVRLNFALASLAAISVFAKLGFPREYFYSKVQNMLLIAEFLIVSKNLLSKGNGFLAADFLNLLHCFSNAALSVALSCILAFPLKSGFPFVGVEGRFIVFRADIAETSLCGAEICEFFLIGVGFHFLEEDGSLRHELGFPCC